MERSTWTDERLNDMVARGDRQFDLLLSEFRDMRAEMRDMRAEMSAIRRDMFRGAIALFGVLAAMYTTTLIHILS